MLASINPLGERSRNSRFGITFVTYLVGSLAGGAAMGAVLGMAGEALRAVAPWGSTATAMAVVAACVLGLAFDGGVAGLRIPSLRRQVNEDWLMEYREWVYGAGFGLQLGAGVTTIVTTATVYVTFALAFLAGSWTAGLVIGAVFGLARAVPMLLVTRVHEPSQLRRLVRRAHGWATVAQRGALVTLLAAGTVGAVAALN